MNNNNATDIVAVNSKPWRLGRLGSMADPQQEQMTSGFTVARRRCGWDLPSRTEGFKKGFQSSTSGAIIPVGIGGSPHGAGAMA
jgi:hypothetical protein